ncbi:YgaP family membrane protein [Fluviicola taffensis]|uniref:Inner membrane protein YgaP-like transmembrane domain-containing protein n=1 Tax=Fluviicola taffensis (strain DSM 16823 / NCIMB 13979 / RW262) TaxID=755732 RepID=F2ID80_FLUTR|nr:hypothetical protein Fluta_3526 [Fluviicola taffensis DSM 16823]
MNRNMYSTDRIIRLILSIILVSLYFFGYISGILAIIALVVVIIFMLTSVIGFCPLYKLLGITIKKKSK